MRNKSIAIVIGLLCFFGGKEIAKKAVDYFRGEPGISESLMNQQWAETKIGPDDLIVSTPLILEEKIVDIPLEAKNAIREMRQLSAEGEGINVGVMYASYQDGVELSLQGAEEGAIANMKKQPGTISVATSIHSTTVAGMRAREIEATIERERGKALTMHALIMIKDLNTVIVIFGHRKDQPLGSAIWSRIKDGIHN